jgi:hypothetical protein
LYGNEIMASSSMKAHQLAVAVAAENTAIISCWRNGWLMAGGVKYQLFSNRLFWLTHAASMAYLQLAASASAVAASAGSYYNGHQWPGVWLSLIGAQ